MTHRNAADRDVRLVYHTTASIYKMQGSSEQETEKGSVATTEAKLDFVHYQFNSRRRKRACPGVSVELNTHLGLLGTFEK